MAHLIAQKGPSPQFAGARPVIDTTADDWLLTKLGLFDAGLLYAMDPQAWNGLSPVNFREKANAHCKISASAAPHYFDDVNFEGRRVINYSTIATNTIMPMEGSKASKSCTIVFAATRAATPRQGVLYSSTWAGSLPHQFIRQSVDGSLYFCNTNNNDLVNQLRIDASAMAAPSASDPHVFAISYDDTTRAAAAFIDDGVTPVVTKTMGIQSTVSTSDQLYLGGISTGTGSAWSWGAKLGRFFYFDNALHLNYPDALSELMKMLRSIYDI